MNDTGYGCLYALTLDGLQSVLRHNLRCLGELDELDMMCGEVGAEARAEARTRFKAKIRGIREAIERKEGGTADAD